jgi:hypothetical protein
MATSLVDAPGSYSASESQPRPSVLTFLRLGLGVTAGRPSHRSGNSSRWHWQLPAGGASALMPVTGPPWGPPRDEPDSGFQPLSR